MFLFPSRETPKWTHRTEFIDELIAVPRQNIRSENALNVAINKQPQLLANFREREKERALIKRYHERIKASLRGISLRFLARRFACSKKQISTPPNHQAWRGAHEDSQTRYSPAQCMEPRPAIISGNPDRNHVSTSYIERQNLTMPMSMRRFTRLTKSFQRSLKTTSMRWRFVACITTSLVSHQSSRVTPAMEADVTDHVWTLPEIIALLAS
ncbi:MAG: hypothetical protein AUH91_00075 [Verrucomicrobia bacterium 13_1_40CM_4_54_4]|nr:MAG: hypothetical protein AUH91_00075 [Verrucomicrobia bacterium 13_1_40CM_4_54_4]